MDRQRVLGLVLAGGAGKRLGPLTQVIQDAATPIPRLGIARVAANGPVKHIETT